MDVKKMEGRRRMFPLISEMCHFLWLSFICSLLLNISKLSIFVRVLKLDCNAHKYWFHSFFCLQVFWARETRQPRETMDFLIKSRPCAGRVKTLLSLGVTLYALLFLGLGPGPHVSTCWLFPIILKVTVGAIQPKVQCRGFNFWHYLSACFSCLCYEPI